MQSKLSHQLKDSRRPTAVLALAVLLLGLPSEVPAGNLNEHLWRHRLLILVALEATDYEVDQQLGILIISSDALIDRDIRVYQLYQRGISLYQDRPLTAECAARLRTELRAKPNTKILLLIGKDGTIKRRTPINTDLRDVFVQIDEMPMRRTEIRETIKAGRPLSRP